MAPRGLYASRGVKLRALQLDNTEVTDAGAAERREESATNLPLGPTPGAGVRSRPPRRLARLYIGGVWIRETNGPHMRRLLGCLLVMGVVRCGDDPSPSGDDPISTLEKLGGWIRRDRQGEVVNVSFALHRWGMVEVTDEQLVHLEGLTKLKTLYLEGTRVSAAGLADLKKSLPICKIER